MHVERAPPPRRSAGAARWPSSEVYPRPALEVPYRTDASWCTAHEDRAQRQGDGRPRGQGGMRTQEIEPQRVVRGGHRTGRRLDLRGEFPPPPRCIGAGGVEELTPGHGGQPALRVPRRVVRPHAHGLDQSVLHGNHGGGEGPQQGLVHVASLRDGWRRGQERASKIPRTPRRHRWAQGAASRPRREGRAGEPDPAAADRRCSIGTRCGRRK